MRADIECSILPTPNIRMFHSAKRCRRFLEKRGVPFNPMAMADAQTWMFDSDGEDYAVVLFNCALDSHYVRDVSLLAHEATHIALHTFDAIGEENPADEEFCYMIQAITETLAKAHFRWKERRLKSAS